MEGQGGDMATGFLFEVMKVFKTDYGDGCISVNILETTALYT